MSNKEGGSSFDVEWLNVKRISPESQIKFTEVQKSFLDLLGKQNKTFGWYFITSVGSNSDMSLSMRQAVREFVLSGMHYKIAEVRINGKTELKGNEIDSTGLLTELNLTGDIYTALNSAGIGVPDSYTLTGSQLRAFGMNKEKILYLQNRLFEYVSELAQWTGGNVNYIAAYKHNLPNFRRKF